MPAVRNLSIHFPARFYRFDVTVVVVVIDVVAVVVVIVVVAVVVDDGSIDVDIWEHPEEKMFLRKFHSSLRLVPAFQLRFYL